MNKSILLLIAATLVPIPASAQKCPDWNDRDCREDFVRQNLPTPAKPDLDASRDNALSDEIKSTIIRARMLMITEKALDAQLTGIKNPASFSLDALKRRFIDGQSEKYNDKAVGLQRQIVLIRTQEFQAYNHAIAKTIELYHLVPKVTGPIDHSDAAISDPMLPWRPHFSQHIVSDGKGGLREPTKDENRESWLTIRGVRFPENANFIPDLSVSGTDKNNDNLVVFRGAFFKNDGETPDPDKLASYIYHETVHWLDNNALGRKPHPKERFQSEVVAYQAQIDAADTFNLSNSEVEGFQRLKEKYAYQAAHAPEHDADLKQPQYKNWEPAENIVTPDLDDQNSVYEIDAIVAAAVKAARAETRRQEEENPPPPKDPGAVAVPAQLAAPDDSYPTEGNAPHTPEDPGAAAQPAYLAGNGARMAAALARNVCESPNGVSDPLFDYLTWQESDPEEAARISPSLSGCVRAVFDKMVRALSSGYRLNAALARSFIPPPQAPIVTPRSRSRDRDDEPPSRHSPDDWNSLRQLRGLNR